MESIYTLLSAMKGQQRQMDAVANNLANINTTAYKGDQVLFREYYNELIGQDLESEEEMFAHHEYLSPFTRGGTSFVMPDHVFPSMERGIFKNTDNPLDLAIQSKGFFVVDTLHGVRYTRNGQFQLDAKGFLITNSEDKVLGKKGPIQIQTEDIKNFSVGQDGALMVGNKVIDSLQIVGFSEENRLTKLGNSYWVPAHINQKPEPLEYVNIHQGVLENSNVDAVQEMVKMIAVNRSYEAAQKMIRSLDEIDDQSISISRV